METDYQRAVLQMRILWIWMRQSIERGDEKNVQEKYADAWFTACNNVYDFRTEKGLKIEAMELHHLCPSIKWQTSFKKPENFQKK